MSEYGNLDLADELMALRAENTWLKSLFNEQSDLQSEHIKCLNERWDKEREILTAEIARLRDETLEEAAKAAEGFPKNREWVPGSLYDTLRREVAEAIRRLK